LSSHSCGPVKEKGSRLGIALVVHNNFPVTILEKMSSDSTGNTERTNVRVASRMTSSLHVVKLVVKLVVKPERRATKQWQAA
jgi:hypothetical protein